MKAVRVVAYGGPEVLQVQEVPKPIAGAGQLLLKVAACGINPLDAWFRSGHLSARFERPIPYTPGADVVGTVVECGEGVSAFAAGDVVMGVLPVLADGGYAEYTVVDADRMTAVLDGVDPVMAAAALTPAITGVQMAEKALALGGGKRMLVIGALGGVGRAAVVTMPDHGVDVTVVVRPGREDAARALGAVQIVTGEAAARHETLGGTFDVVLDLVGPDQVSPWEHAISENGAVISVVPVAPAPFSRSDVSFSPFAYSPNAEATFKVVKMLHEGKLTIPDVEVLGINETGKAHAVLPGNAGGRKFVVIPSKAD